MTSINRSSREPEPESVVLASFESSRHAEHMLASLGRAFRSDARKGEAAAVVVTGNPDGSLKLTQSRVLTASGFGYAVIRVSLAWMVGFLGTLPMLKGARGGIQAARIHEQHVGADELRAHQILGDAGPKAAVVLIRCANQQTLHKVATAASDQAVQSWDGSLTEFLAALDSGSTHDWVRDAVGKTSRPSHHRSTDQPPQ